MSFAHYCNSGQHTNSWNSSRHSKSKHNAGVCQVGIELPLVNRALVEVHRELATVNIGAKDMATKNKNPWKTVKVTHDQLEKAQERIAQLEGNTTMTQQNPEPTSND